MRFPITDRDFIIDARNHGVRERIFRSDDQYIENLIIDNVRFDDENIEFTQIFRILPAEDVTGLPPVTHSFISNNAVNIMKFYKSKCESVEWHVYESTVPDANLSPSDIDLALSVNTSGSINNFKRVDSG